MPFLCTLPVRLENGTHVQIRRAGLIIPFRVGTGTTTFLQVHGGARRSVRSRKGEMGRTWCFSVVRRKKTQEFLGTHGSLRSAVREQTQVQVGPAGGTCKEEGKDGSGRVREEVDSEKVWVVLKECRLEASD